VWNIPGSIARKEILPLIRKNPSYLAKHHIAVLRGWGPQTKVLNPRAINWTKLSVRHFPYRLRQEPGPHNALGQVKFNLPNPFTVYLHDTPARELFTKSMRAFSHGCIRIEKPIELAEYLLRDPQQWTRERLLLAIEQGEQQTVTLSHPVPVFVGYWTAWVDQDQQVYFARDLYGRDAALEKRKMPDNTTLGRASRQPSGYSSTHSQSCENSSALFSGLRSEHSKQREPTPRYADFIEEGLPRT
jgi:murein L,D-transpeptidase YcbB/YkuD